MDSKKLVKLCKNADANTHLIAAAPELLAALEDIFIVANIRIDDPDLPVFGAARAAIAKARGESDD